MLNSGDVVLVDLGLPAGHEAGFRHPAVLVTAQLRAVSPARLGDSVGNVGVVMLAQIRETIATILDIGE